MLNVTETTVKRWAERQLINCSKTIGGHRKFELKEVRDFAQKNSIPISGMTAPPLSQHQKEKLGYAIYSSNFKTISEIFFEEALQGDREGLLDLMIYLHKNQIQFSVIVDEIIRPAMVEIGIKWERGELGVNQEHTASESVKLAVARFAAQMFNQKKKNLKVICACVESEQHDLGIQFLFHELVRCGYEVTYMGANTPFESLKDEIASSKPNIVFLSATSPNISQRKIKSEIESLSRECKKLKSRLILGGIYIEKLNNKNLISTETAFSITEAVKIIRKQKGKL